MKDKSEESAVLSKNPTKIWNPAFCNIFFVNTILNLCQYTSNALLPKHVDSLGMQAATIGMLMSAFTVTSLLLRLVAGPVMDTHNKRNIVVVAMMGLAVAFLGFSISTTISMLMIFRLLQGAIMAFGNACCLALVAETIPKDKYAGGVGYYAIALTIAQALGPLCGLTLLDWFGYRTAYLINSGFILSAAFLASRLKHSFKRTKKIKINFDSIIAKEAVLPSLLQAFIYMSIFSINSFLIVYAEKQGVIRNIGLYFTVNAAIMLLTRPLIGKLSDRFGLIKVLIPSLISSICALCIISVSDTLWKFIVAAVVAAFGFGACVPILQSLTMKSVKKERRGAGSSTNYIFMDIGVLTGSNLAGLIAQAFGYTRMWLFMATPLIIAICLTFLAGDSISRIEEDFKNGDIG
jgi:MFS family permease